MTKLRRRMTEELCLRGFSERTVSAYVSCVRRFAEHYWRGPETLGTEQIRSYLVHLTHLGRAPATVNQAIAALGFFYREVISRPEMMDGIRFQKQRERPLPVVLTTAEVRRLLSALEGNLKHLAMGMTLYSTGLRVGEMVALVPSDVDSEAMRLRVRKTKGGKERRVMLSPRLLEVLRRYWAEYRPRTVLFYGQDPTRAIHTRSVARALARGAERAKLSKRVTPHTLRHSFATHLMDQGVSLRHIQELLGHRYLKSTMRYTRIHPEGAAQVVSPLDRLE